MPNRIRSEREKRRAAAARRARDDGPHTLPEWPPGQARPHFASEAEEVQFLRSYDFSKHSERITSEWLSQIATQADDEGFVPAMNPSRLRDTTMNIATTVREALANLTWVQLHLAQLSVVQPSDSEIEEICTQLQDIMNRLEEYLPIQVEIDDPSPCVHCGRPKTTSQTAFNAEGVCWRKPSMVGDNVSVSECMNYQREQGKKDPS